MAAECVCDYGDGPADVYAKTLVRARKEHRCDECHKRLRPGETYERAAMLYDGSWDVMKTCARCLDVRDYVEAHAPCFCWLHGSMLEDARQVVAEYGYESAGFFIGAMKRILRAERGPAVVAGRATIDENRPRTQKGDQQ